MSLRMKTILRVLPRLFVVEDHSIEIDVEINKDISKVSDVDSKSLIRSREENGI